MYKYEMHLHTADVSPCAGATAEQIVQAYSEMGYSGVNVTNHWSREVLDYKNIEGLNLNERADFYMDGYRRMEEAAEGKLTVFCGVEVQIDEPAYCEFLVYNISRDFILDLGMSFYKLTKEELTRIAHDHGCMIYQSHPFRDGLTILPTEIFRRVGEPLLRDKVDGIEAINYSHGDRYTDDIALNWAKEHNLRTITGSDYHGDWNNPWGGIYTDKPIGSQSELIDVLNNDRYALALPDGPIAGVGVMHPEHRFTTHKRKRNV